MTSTALATDLEADRVQAELNRYLDATFPTVQVSTVIGALLTVALNLTVQACQRNHSSARSLSALWFAVVDLLVASIRPARSSHAEAEASPRH